MKAALRRLLQNEFQAPGPGSIVRLGGETMLIKDHFPTQARIPRHMAAVLLFEKLMAAGLIRGTDAAPVGLGQPLGNLVWGGELLGLGSG